MWEFLLNLAGSGEVFEQDDEEFGTPKPGECSATIVCTDVCRGTLEAGDAYRSIN